MNKTFFFALAIGTAMAGIACGDDTGSGGSADTSGSTSSGSTKATTATGTGASSGSTKASSGTTTGGSTSSGMAMGPCVDECMNDAGCDAMPPAPGMACGDCVQMAGDTQAACAIAAATGAKCQGNADCAALVTCILGGMMNCEMMHQEGYGVLRLEVLKSCGDCGPGAP